MPTSPDITLGAGFVRTYELFEEVQSDVLGAYRLLHEDRDSQFLRRTVVRAVFSFVDALLEIIKVEVRSSLRLEEFDVSLSDRELGILGGMSITPRPGDQKFLPIDDNLKATFKIAAKVWQLARFQLESDGENYRDFVRAKDARNRLTHPRTYYDIQVTDEDMHCHTVAFDWVSNEFQRIFKHRCEALATDVPAEVRERLLSKFEDGISGA